MFRSRTPIMLFAMIILLLASVPAFAMELGGHERDGTVIGLDLGYGWNTVKFTNTDGQEVSSGSIDAFNGGFQVGWAPNDNFIGSIGMNGWRRNYYTQAGNFDTRYYSFNLEGYWFPRGEGFWIKGGIGYGTVELTLVAPARIYNVNSGGMSLGTGVGYEFRIADSTALALAYIYQYTNVGDFEGGTDTTVSNNSVSLTFHFYVQ
jgi:hypothetical protein